MMKTYEFGKTADGQVITSYVLENEQGIRAEFLNLGCILRQLWVPSKEGALVNIVHGLDSVAEYEADTSYFGAFIGRFANRIMNARFSLNGREYDLLKNDGANYLHGSWNRRVFDAKPLQADTLEEASRGVVFTYHSPDGEDGFPGNVDVTVTYILDDDNILHMDYEAVSDQDTVMNFTNHSYFNLGAGQTVTVKANEYLEIDEEQIIPTGQICPVSEPAVMDLRKPVDVEKSCPSMGFFDNCYILDHSNGTGQEPDVVLHGPGRGISLELYTSEPAVQIFSGNPVGVAMEPQMYPCAPNFPDFPSSVVKAGEVRKWKNSLRIVL